MDLANNLAQSAQDAADVLAVLPLYALAVAAPVVVGLAVLSAITKGGR